MDIALAGLNGHCAGSRGDRHDFDINVRQHELIWNSVFARRSCARAFFGFILIFYWPRSGSGIK